jgi:hypothetical protein
MEPFDTGRRGEVVNTVCLQRTARQFRFCAATSRAPPQTYKPSRSITLVLTPTALRSLHEWMKTTHHHVEVHPVRTFLFPYFGPMLMKFDTEGPYLKVTGEFNLKSYRPNNYPHLPMKFKSNIIPISWWRWWSRRWHEITSLNCSPPTGLLFIPHEDIWACMPMVEW